MKKRKSKRASVLPPIDSYSPPPGLGQTEAKNTERILGLPGEWPGPKDPALPINQKALVGSWNWKGS